MLDTAAEKSFYLFVVMELLPHFPIL